MSKMPEDDHEDYEDLKQNLKKLEIENQRLATVTSHLVAAFQMNICSQANISTMLQNCKEIYPELFSPQQNFNGFDPQMGSFISNCMRNCIQSQETHFINNNAQDASKGISDTKFKKSTSSPMEETSKQAYLFNMNPPNNQTQYSHQPLLPSSSNKNCCNNKKCCPCIDNDSNINRPSTDKGTNRESPPTSRTTRTSFSSADEVTAAVRSEIRKDNVASSKSKEPNKLKQSNRSQSSIISSYQKESTKQEISSISNSRNCSSASFHSTGNNNNNSIRNHIPNPNKISQQSIQMRSKSSTISKKSLKSIPSQPEQEITKTTNQEPSSVSDTKSPSKESDTIREDMKQTGSQTLPDSSESIPNENKNSSTASKSSTTFKCPESVRECICDPGDCTCSKRELDFRKIKEDLLGADNQSKSVLLQALRRMLIQDCQAARDKFLFFIINHDLLYISNKNVGLIESYYQDPELQETMSRFLNALSSLKQGRDYLEKYPGLVSKMLVPYLRSSQVPEDSPSRCITLAVLQKLSLRPLLRKEMISAGLLNHIIEYLKKNLKVLSPYCLEYSTALFMNLCLEKEARNICSKKPKEMITLIKRLVPCDHACIMPYINGALFTLLAESAIKNEAIAQDLDKCLIESIKTNKDIHLQKQTEFVLYARLYNDGEFSDTQGSEAQDEVDLLEDQIDEETSEENCKYDKILNNYTRGYVLNRCDAKAVKEIEEAVRESRNDNYSPDSEDSILRDITERALDQIEAKLVDEINIEDDGIRLMEGMLEKGNSKSSSELHTHHLSAGSSVHSELTQNSVLTNQDYDIDEEKLPDRMSYPTSAINVRLSQEQTRLPVIELLELDAEESNSRKSDETKQTEKQVNEGENKPGDGNENDLPCKEELLKNSTNAGANKMENSGCQCEIIRSNEFPQTEFDDTGPENSPLVIEGHRCFEFSSVSRREKSIIIAEPNKKSNRRNKESIGSQCDIVESHKLDETQLQSEKKLLAPKTTNNKNTKKGHKPARGRPKPNRNNSGKSRSSSQDLSYCEETKQLIHKPNSNKRIFERCKPPTKGPGISSEYMSAYSTKSSSKYYNRSPPREDYTTTIGNEIMKCKLSLEQINPSCSGRCRDEPTCSWKCPRLHQCEPCYDDYDTCFGNSGSPLHHCPSGPCCQPRMCKCYEGIKEIIRQEEERMGRTCPKNRRNWTTPRTEGPKPKSSGSLNKDHIVPITSEPSGTLSENLCDGDKSKIDKKTKGEVCICQGVKNHGCRFCKNAFKSLPKLKRSI